MKDSKPIRIEYWLIKHKSLILVLDKVELARKCPTGQYELLVRYLKKRFRDVVVGLDFNVQ